MQYTNFVKYAIYPYILIFIVSTLNGFAAQRSVFLAQSMGHHAQIGCRTLICFAALSFHPFLVCTSRGFYICVDGVSSACHVIPRQFGDVDVAR